MGMNVRRTKRVLLSRMGLVLGVALQFYLCLLFTGHPALAQSDQGATSPSGHAPVQGKIAESKHSAKPQKESSPSEVAPQESKSAQLKAQTAKPEESKPKKDNGEEGLEKESPTRNAGSSLILTVKLALMEDPRVFPYEIEVEAGSDEVTLLGKVSSEAEKSTASKIASAVPTVKSVSNKLEVVKELSEIIAHRQDDVITRLVKERFARSATVTSANFDVKTEQGVVALSGTVRFQVIVLEAVEAVRQVPGVRAVKTDKVRIEREG